MVKNLKLSNSLLCVFVCLCFSATSQTDTIYTSSEKKLSCTITEINDNSVSYLANKSVNKMAISQIKKIFYKNGTSEIFVQKPITPFTKSRGFNLSDENTRDLIQKQASKWGTEYLNCGFKDLSLNSTVVDWDITYLKLGNDSILTIGLKSFYSIPLIENREEVFWSIKTNTKFQNPRFNYNRSSNHETILLNCISRLNSVYKP